MPDALKGSAIIAQSGGPTAVINASLCGAVQEALKHKEITAIVGARQGILGVLREELYDLGHEDPTTIEALRHTPSAALSSCRYKLKPEDYDRIIEVLHAHNIRYFFYAGGNDSQDTCHKVGMLAKEKGYELRCIGIPKTVDNDLGLTDHCPGYGSVARYVAIATMDCGRDNEGIYQTDTVKVIETMGRNTGWIAAASALGRRDDEDAPHLVYFPERPFIKEKFLADVQGVLGRFGRAVIAVSEGLVDENGEYLVADKSRIATDGFGHAQLSGVGDLVCQLIMRDLSAKARFNKPGTCQRSSIVCQSSVDRDEAYMVGQRAVQLALEGVTDMMVTLVRESNDPYRCTTGTVETGVVANAEKPFPDEFINAEGNHVTEAYREYAMPLIGGPLPEYVRLGAHPLARKTSGWSKA